MVAAAAAAAAVEEKQQESAMEELKGILVGFLHVIQSPDFDYEASYWSTDYRKVSIFCLFTKKQFNDNLFSSGCKNK